VLGSSAHSSTRFGGRILNLRADAGATACESGERSADLFAPLSDHLIAVEPNKQLVDASYAARPATALPRDVRMIRQIRSAGPRLRRSSAGARMISSADRRWPGGQRRFADDGGLSRTLRSSCAQRTWRVGPFRAGRISTRSSRP